MSSSSIEIPGVKLAVSASGIKRNNDAGAAPPLDLVLIEAAAGSSVAVTFTQNRFAAAPVILAREHMHGRVQSEPSYLLINSGNANAGTGPAGMDIAKRSCQSVAQHAGVAAENVLPFSTGVIGELFDVECIEKAMPGAFDSLHADGWVEAATAIMTTDTVAKHYYTEFELFGERYKLAGISKGAGMIQPNMATMLCYMATDLNVEQVLLQTALLSAVEQSFNRITVDGDTSTNDACVLLATGADKNKQLTDVTQSEYSIFCDVLNAACLDLAQQIIRDAEGATKLVRISVEQGSNEADCLTVAYTIAHSPLVKTALYASDPNWGRILAAVGRAPIASLDVDSVSLFIDDVLIAESGARAVNYSEAKAKAIMQGAEYTLRVLLGAGEAEAAIWTCDLSHDYISINADYRS